MCHRLHSQLVVGAVHAHGLLTHRTLQSIFGGLVVVGEGNNRASYSE